MLRSAMNTDETASERGWVFGLVIAPVGALMQGVVQGGVLSYLLSRQGTSSAVQAHLIGLLSLRRPAFGKIAYFRLEPVILPEPLNNVSC